ncbi:hypothetical protein [Agromyces silvae]|uniref:hypothetical protein n=1 Tax=Agromyces silvae TaxID=3388266 RepID=UPI00280B2D11|nr:hypothetical protein [Agromyces protaetiae]
MAVVVALGMVLASTCGFAPASAGDRGADSDAVVFDLGNGVAAHIQPVTSEVRFTTPTPLVWDPRLLDLNNYDFGAGWTFDQIFVRGLDFYIPALGRFFEWDGSSPSGLIGYPWDDLRVDVAIGGEVPARGDIPARSYDWTIRYLETNVTEYFNRDGDLIASINSSTGARDDWVWNLNRTLNRVVDDSGGVIRSERVDPAEHHFTMPDGRLISTQLDGGRVFRILTPSQSTTFVMTTPRWLTRTEDAAGATNPREYQFVWEAGRTGTAQDVWYRDPVLDWRIVWRGGELEEEDVSG